MSHNITPKVYHAQREQERLAQSEQIRLERLTAVRAAIRRLAPDFLAIEAVYLSGSVMQPGRHRRLSDIDVAVKTNDVAAESAFWQALLESCFHHKLSSLSNSCKPCLTGSHLL